MIIRKSPDELDKMRTAGRIVAGTIGRVLETVAPGRTTLDLDRVAEQYIAQFGELARTSNTLILPANAADVGSMIALAMKVITGTAASGGTPPPLRQ